MNRPTLSAMKQAESKALHAAAVATSRLHQAVDNSDGTYGATCLIARNRRILNEAELNLRSARRDVAEWRAF